MIPPSRSHHDPTATSAPPLTVIIRPTGVPVTPPELRLEGGKCIIGAGSGADIIVEDRAVSRQHVELTLCPEGVVVHDLGSRNGTFYRGQRIERAVLSPGSHFRIGNCEVAIHAEPSAFGAAQHPSYRGLIGATEPMRRLFATLLRLEGSLVSVLIEGEPGVGKELVARALHDGSQVAQGPFVVVNCGAIGRGHALSELFGHKPDAFTGATEDRVGAFEAAHGGTLFLDEIGELPLDSQPALLRALESGEIRRVGGNEVCNVKVRVIAATNRDLPAEIATGHFLQDLYQRLAVVNLRVPSLAQRREDIPLLAAQLARAAGAGDLPMEVMVSFSERAWPGNVRELRNAVFAYLAVGHLPERDLPEGSLLELLLRRSIDPDRPYQEQKELLVTLFSRVYFEIVLERAEGNESEAARISGVERSYFGKLLSKYGARR